MICGTIPISVLGTNFAMSQRPFWQPDQYGAFPPYLFQKRPNAQVDGSPDIGNDTGQRDLRDRSRDQYGP
jgi:hypothetical protein